MKTLNLSLLFLLLIAAISCKKADPAGADSIKQGQVIDVNTGKGIPGATVNLFKNNHENIGAMGMKSVDGKITDNNGYFNFEFTRESGYSYYLEAESLPYYGNSGYIYLDPGNHNPILKLGGRGWIRFNIINEPPLDTIEHILINGAVISFHGLYLYSSDTIINSIPMIGDKKNDISYWIKKTNNVEKHISDYIYIPALDTVDYFIKY